MKILKFDLLYPQSYFETLKQTQIKFLEELSLLDYIDWIHSLQIAYGETISFHFKERGWEVLDFYNQDQIFLQKIKLFSGIKPVLNDILSAQKRKDYYHFTLKNLVKAFTDSVARDQIKNEVFIRRFIQYYKPDVIFLREPSQVNNQLFHDLKKKYLIVTLIGCNISHPVNWTPLNSDLIFTIIPEYQQFFQINGIESHLFEYGIVPLDKKLIEKEFDVSFVGLLGTKEQKRKTELMEEIAAVFDFKWWGPKGDQLELFPNLLRTWQGIVAGKEMFDIYRRSKIVVNDYVDTANNQAVNMRIKEVLGAGSFLLTRRAINIRLLEKNGVLKTFDSSTECINLIRFYLFQHNEREQIAKQGFLFATEHFSSRNKVGEMAEMIEKKLQEKYNKR